MFTKDTKGGGGGVTEVAALSQIGGYSTTLLKTAATSISPNTILNTKQNTKQRGQLLFT